jgi:Do/DeqQ family serine protease
MMTESTKKRTMRILKTFGLGVALVTAGFLAGQIMMQESTAVPAAGGDETGGSALPIRSDGTSILAEVAERVGPAVVFIRTERAYGDEEARGDSPWDFFREYFREDGNRRRYHGEGGGSGFVFDAEGRILTNHHVIRGADKITVVLASNGDEEEYEAEVVGADPLTDIAIIQIDPPKNLTTVPLGDSDKMRVGDWVMAIGTPFGQLQGSVTAGIVSALGRDDLNIVGGDAIYQNYIQTDASINFGNSGGPLVNLKGEAIGINTAINPSGQGIGFAIPINMARNIMAQLIERGKVTYGYMGIGLQELDRELAVGRGLEVEAGILVTQVLNNTPADEAGIRQGDVIVEYAGEEVSDENKFRLMVANTPVGKKVPLVVMRGSDKVDLHIEIGQRPEPEALAAAEPSRGEAWLGLHVDDAGKREYRRQYSIDGSQAGVVVVEVEAGSPADEAGIREGDVITEVYTQEVGSLEDYVAVADKLKDRKDPIAFLVKRGRSTTYVTVTPQER